MVIIKVTLCLIRVKRRLSHLYSAPLGILFLYYDIYPEFHILMETCTIKAKLISMSFPFGSYSHLSNKVYYGQKFSRVFLCVLGES